MTGLGGGSRTGVVVRVGFMSDRLVEERCARIAEQVAQAQRNSEATERVREQATRWRLRVRPGRGGHGGC